MDMHDAWTPILRRAGIPQVIAALDGTHIEIRKPPHSGDTYVNRKGYFSLNVSAACDADGIFSDVFEKIM